MKWEKQGLRGHWLPFSLMCDLELVSELLRCHICQMGTTTVGLSPGDAALKRAKHLAQFQFPSLETSVLGRVL